MGENDSTKRYRRTKLNVEKDLFGAANRVIAEVGFSGLTVSRLIKEAKIDPPVFYLRNKDMSEFIDKFVRDYDYWLNNSISIDYKRGHAIENLDMIISNLIDALLDNSCMQKLIAWEMTEDNFITRRTAQNRDSNSEPMIRYFEEQFKGSDVNFNAAAAILIGGVYYLIIHRKMGTFNRVDFSTKEGIDLLKKSMSEIIHKIFDKHHSGESTQIESCKVDIATKLLKDGVSLDIVERSTGISKDVLLTLISQ